jgi:cytochrome c oxidase subunit 4
MADDSKNGEHESVERDAPTPADGSPVAGDAAARDAETNEAEAEPTDARHAASGERGESGTEPNTEADDASDSSATSDADEPPTSDGEDTSSADEERDDQDDDDQDDDQDDTDDDESAHPDSRPSAPVHEGRDAAHGHGMAHVLPLQTLAAVFAALVVLTVITVAVTTIDFGSSTNLAVAMVIATIKASLVLAVFMHLWYDRSINLLLFLTGVLFVVLFISLAMIDRAEYQPSIDELQAVQEAAAQG